MALASAESWLALIIAFAFMQASPGPAVLTVVGYSLSFGKTLAAGLFIAFVLGQVTALVLSVAGIGVILKDSPDAIFLLRLAGGGFLLFVGINALVRNRLLNPETRSASQGTNQSAKYAVANTWFIAATSPIAIVFYIAVLPAYVDYSAIDSRAIATLITIVALVSMTTSAVYILTTCVTRKLLVNEGASVWFSCIGNVVLICTGVWAITSAIKP